MLERREFTRHRTGGDLEITSVIGGAEPPNSRAALINCSRGGALFRLPAPSRGFFKKRVAAPLSARDSITCVLRLPPAYEPIEMFGEVVRVLPDRGEPGQFEVGLRFFHDVSRRTVMDPLHDVLGRLLEPGKLAAEAAAERQRRLENNVRRSPGRMPKAEEEEEEPLSCSEAAQLVAKTSQRLRARSARLPKVEDDEEQPLSCSEAARLVTKTSQRLRASSSAETQRLRRAPSERQDAQATQRLRRASGRQDPQPTRRLRQVSGRVATSSSSRERSASSRQATQPSQRLSLDSSMARRLDDSQLLESGVGATPSLAAWAQTRLHVASEPRLLDLGGQLGVRGRAVLRGGVAVVALPEAFAARVAGASLTVHLTPRGPAALYLAECAADRIVVHAVQRGSEPLEFDYLVLADRGASLRA
ncbi:MAG: PilZ domain-containing protein [Planctomycetes bacterium]|nr:PilZ domain-containing protein [Planctomycetota bacterium]